MTRLVLAAALVLLCTAAGSRPESSPPRIPDPSVPTISSSINGLDLAARRTAVTDTFVLYGGPGTLDGKFQDSEGRPDWQGWEGADRTETPVYWQVSTHNAANLGSHGVGNHAYWCGQTAEQAPHFFHTPGYGSNWDARIMYESDPVADPSVGQSVNLDFLFNIDIEPGYDFMYVEFDSAGQWVRLHHPYEFDGTNHDASNVFPAPGLRFSDFGRSTFQYVGGDFGGDDADRIRVRIRLRTDSAFDDQSGLWPTVGGALQIDDIALSHDGVSFFEDFEGPGPYLFQPVLEPFAGDFSEIFAAMEDLDPYRENRSPAAAFIDYGQEPRNGPGLDGTRSTGGTTSPTWDYGIAGGFVVNHSGGLTAAEPTPTPLHNEIWSPWIDWDLPGPEDDDPDLIGAILSFDVYEHLSVSDGMFFEWRIGPGASYDFFGNDDTVYYGENGPLWRRFVVDVTEYLRPVVQPRIRIALGVHDYADLFGFPGADASPAPYFDNVRLVKYRVAGLRIRSAWDGALDSSWPYATSLDVSTPAGRDALDIGLTGTADVVQLRDQPSRTDVRLVWALEKNLLFEDAIRVVPASSQDENVVTGPSIWTGEWVPEEPWSPTFDFTGVLSGAFYPGDRLEYYIRAEDADGRVTTLPADVTGFGSFDGSYDRRFTVRGLPSIRDTTGTQAPTLVYAGGAARTDLGLVLSSLSQLGLVEGIDFDVRTREDFAAGLGWTATPELLGGYETILAFGGGGSDYAYREWSLWLQPSYLHERIGLDEVTLTLLTDWADLPGDRNLVLFGSLPGFSLANGAGIAPSFLASELGMQLVAEDLRPAIGDQTSPEVVALGSGFTSGFSISGDQRTFMALEHVEPIAPAVRGHAFTVAGSTTHPTAAASVLKVETVGPDTKVHLTFPYAFRFIQAGVNRSVGASSRARLLSEIFDAIGAAEPSGLPTSTPELHHARMELRPNPFNPRTTLALTLPATGRVTVKVFDLRGRLVRTLFAGRLEAGPHDLEFDGNDERGASLASGVYLVRARYHGGELIRKALLVK